ncbi:hypothetical protein HK104_006231 [Borealophlyctis nickersoniae]|nr:hypothetical protein HK104_006231 [Borealophlyctis nickersoniae]
MSSSLTTSTFEASPTDNTTLPLILSNLTDALNATLNSSQAQWYSSSDATAPYRDTVTNLTQALNATLNATLTSSNKSTVTLDEVNPDAVAFQTFREVERGHINAAVFGGLVVWSIGMLIKAASAYSTRRKPIYLLNLIQCCLCVFKTTAAAAYAVVLNLSCAARSPLINVPMILCWDVIYGIMLLKLLLFARYKLLCKIMFAVGVTVHFVIVLVAISQRVYRMSTVGLCGDKYPLLYKQQYVIEMVMEGFTAITLLHGLIMQRKAATSLFSGTQDILRQLAQNEHLRVFLVVFLITLKVALAYSPSADFKIVAFTHAVDSARSALVCWALIREQRKVAAAASMRGSTSNRMSAAGPGAGPKTGIAQGPPKMLVQKYSAAVEDDGSARTSGIIGRLGSLRDHGVGPGRMGSVSVSGQPNAGNMV